MKCGETCIAVPDSLTEVLKTNKDWIDPLNQAQIICDVSALTETGHVSYGDLDFLLDNDRDCQSDAGVNLAFLRCLGRCFYDALLKLN